MAMIIHCIDDQEICLSGLEERLRSWEEDTNMELEIERFFSGEEYFASEKKEPDIIFLDIELKSEMNGLTIAQKMRNEKYQGELVFLTSYTSYVFDGYNYNALNYLLKPVTKESIERLMKQYLEKHGTSEFMIQQQRKKIAIPYASICYMKSQGHYVEIHCADQKVQTVRGTIEQMMERLPRHFMMCSRGYAVNLHHVLQIQREMILLEEGESIPLSRRRSGEVMRQYSLLSR